MAEPTTSYDAVYPGELYPGNTQRERDLSNNGLIADARAHNIQDEEIKATQAFLGLSETPFDPSGPVPGSGETIVKKIVRIGGTAACIEEGIICNFGGASGVDPNGLIIGKTAEPILRDLVDPTGIDPSGWIPLAVPEPSGVFCPPFPEQPPWDPTPPTPFPEYPVPDGYPWPGFDPDIDDAFPTGPWMQYVQWAVGTLFTLYQAQNAGNIHMGPAGLKFQGMPSAWRDFIGLGKVFTETTPFMPLVPGRPLPDPAVTDRAAIFDALDPTLSMLSQLRTSEGVEFVVLTGNGTNTITHVFTTPVDGGAFGTDHELLFPVFSQDNANYTVDQVEASAVKIVGVNASGSYDIVFDQIIQTGHRVILVHRGMQPGSVQGDENSWRNIIVGGVATFPMPELSSDGKGTVPIMMVMARVVAGTGAWVPLNFVVAPAANANEYDLTGGGGTTVGTFAPAGYTEVNAIYLCTRVT